MHLTRIESLSCAFHLKLDESDVISDDFLKLFFRATMHNFPSQNVKQRAHKISALMEELASRGELFSQNGLGLEQKCVLRLCSSCFLALKSTPGIFVRKILGTNSRLKTGKTNPLTNLLFSLAGGSAISTTTTTSTSRP